MTRALVLITLVLSIGSGCAGDDGGGPADARAQAAPADARTGCPNAIASDENCGACLKQWGSGASYCAAGCEVDGDCAGMSSGWGELPLVCHAGGYCTRTCTDASDCWLGDGADYACDDGQCTVCIDCY